METEDKATYQARRFEFKHGLYTISSKLTTPDVNKLKFMLSDFLPKQQLETVDTGFDLLCLVATKNDLLSPNNYIFLKEVLQEVDKSYFIETAFSNPGINYFLPMLNSPLRHHSSQLHQRPKLFQIKKLYGDVCDGLSSQNVHDLCLFFADIGEALRYHEVHRITSAEQLFSKLEEGHMIGIGKLLPLRHVLVQIGRLDLASLVDAFNASYEANGRDEDSSLISGSSSFPASLPETDGVLSTHELLSKIEEQEKKLDCQTREISREGKLLRDNLKIKNSEVESLTNEISKLQELLWQKNDVPVYSMTQSPHGLAIIFINKKFDPNPQKPHVSLKERMGAVKDTEFFSKTFRFLQYDTRLCFDFTAAEMKQVMNQLSQSDHSMYDSFVCCISSHGNQIGFYGSDTVLVHRNCFIDSIKSCSTLINKPKLFFFQACRITAVEADSPEDDVIEPSFLHPDSDILIANASTEGTPAYTSPESGSWFAKAIMSKLTDPNLVYSRTLQQLLEEVTNLVCSSAGMLPGGEQVNQCVDVTTRMRKGVKFFLHQQ